MIPENNSEILGSVVFNECGGWATDDNESAVVQLLMKLERNLRRGEYISDSLRWKQASLK